MPYAYELNPAEPAGGEDARFLDDAVRSLTAAVRERLETIVADVDAQPLVLTASAPIADNSVTQPKMADASVGTAELIDLNVTEPKFAAKAVSTRALADDAVTQVQMADGSVGAPQIIDGSVGNAELADDSVDARTIINGGVGGPQIVDGAVGTTKYADDSITQVKINAVLAALLTTMVIAQRNLSQAETSVPNDQYKEFDIACPGAQVGKPVDVQWSNGGFPNPGAPSSGGWQPGDGMLLRAWCISANTIRIRIMNRTGATIDMGATGAVVKVSQTQFLDGH